VRSPKCQTYMKEPSVMQRIGSVQALSQLLCQFSKSFSGVMGDVLGSQSKILIFGTAMTVASKPLFAVSSLVFSTFGAGACLWCITIGKLVDRVSKGFREAPTKALISQTAREAREPSDAAFSTLIFVMSFAPSPPQFSTVAVRLQPIVPNTQRWSG
jgi:MFS family permease